MNNLHPKILNNGTLDLKPAHKMWLMKHVGKFATVSISEPSRSGQQNRYYWLYLGVIENETGNSASDLHEFFKRKLLPPKHIVIKGKMGLHEVRIPRSTTDLTKVEFGEYMEKICAMVAIPLPDPEEAGFFTK